MSAAGAVDADHYKNPLAPKIEPGRTVDSCADPTVLRGHGDEAGKWYMFCTTDPLNDEDTSGSGDATFHTLPMMVSRDLVKWRYVGDARPDKPSWAAAEANLWAPDLVYSKTFDRYYLTFVVTDTTKDVSGVECPSADHPGTDNAIGVATSKSPTGPWTVSDTPVIRPRKDPGNTDPCGFLWTFDPDVLGNSIADKSVLYYGSYYGGVWGQPITLTRRGMQLDGNPTQIAISDRYEGSNVVHRGGWYYYFGSATNCCAGPITGYSVFAGRSRDPLGPFKDRDGNTLLQSRVGGTPVISMNGNRWIGTGHSSTFRDFDGQWWTVYHAVDRNDPYFATEPGFTKRPALLDPVTWRDGWPSVRDGRWASDTVMPAPAAQPGEVSQYRPVPVAPQRAGKPLPHFTAGFNSDHLGSRWSWSRKPTDTTTYGVENGRFRFDVQQKADLSNNTDDPNDDTKTASVLLEDAPKGDFVVQTKVGLNLPREGAFNYAQAGIVLYGSDDSFLKLVHVGIWGTRQTEWAKEIPTVPAGLDPTASRYGNTVVGPPSTVTRLRIVKETRGSNATFTAYTRQTGGDWVRGGTWVHNRLGDNVKIGLVSMGEKDPVPFTAHFDYVKVWSLR
jgi:arabinan endo-1,5-alpha-L-arabinosidase